MTQREVLAELERIQHKLMGDVYQTGWSRDADIISEARTYLIEYMQGHAPERTPKEWDAIWEKQR